ncbi:Uncharacterised protein [Porphyromonas macacae]|uniref:Uncharacterized protein n=1 Tax=Porphyromonas macacae TaxID=28115 RepID=A0A379E668_9PORP|nr:hypothetical protein [Porphyromonas macacae]SUB88213.1 Uncharacterised protein [Porphyromonas macacae]
MINIFKYMYYRLFTWNLKKWGRYDCPQGNALIGVSFMMFFNLNALGVLLDLLGCIKYLDGAMSKFEITAIFVVISAVNYFWLMHKGKFLQLVKHYKKESKAERRKNTFILWEYVVISFILPFLMISIEKQLAG